MGRHLFKPGDRCDEYDIIELLGAGGFAEVYKAKHTESGELVALKCLQLRHGENRHIVQRMKAEAELLNTVDHNNLVEVLDFGKSGNVLYMAMELLVGRPLRDLLDERSGKLPLQRVLYIVREIADGLAAAHERGVVHRDLKPENIFITDDNRVKVLDLGAGKFFGWGLTSTVPGYVIGTPLYMAPEHVLGHPVDGRTDVFSLGLMLYEMVADHPLQRMRDEGASKMEVAALQVHFKPPPPRVLNPDIPEDVSALVMKAIEKEPSNRFRSMREMAQAIRRARKAHSAELRRRTEAEERPVDLSQPPSLTAADAGRSSDEITTTKRSPGLRTSAPDEATTAKQTILPVVDRPSGGTERMPEIDAATAAMHAAFAARRLEQADTEPYRASDASVPPVQVSSPVPSSGVSSDVSEAASNNVKGSRSSRLSRSRSRPRATGPLVAGRVRRALRKKVAGSRTGVMLLLFGAVMAALSVLVQWAVPSFRSSPMLASPKVEPASVAPSAAGSWTVPGAATSAATSAATTALAVTSTPAATSSATETARAAETAQGAATAAETPAKPKAIATPQSAAAREGGRRKPPPKSQPVFLLE